MPGVEADRRRAARCDPDVGRRQSGERGVQLLAGLQERMSHRLQQRRDVGKWTSEPDFRSVCHLVLSRPDRSKPHMRWKFFSISRLVRRSTTGRPCGQTLE